MTLLEFTRPHPQLYGTSVWKGYGTVHTHAGRMQVDFESKDGEYILHYGEPKSSGESYVWLTQVHQKSGAESRLEFKQFRKYKQLVSYLKQRFGIDLTGLKSHMLQSADTPKWYWRGMK